MYLAYMTIISTNKKSKRNIIYTKYIINIADRILKCLKTKPKRDKCFWLLIGIVQLILTQYYCINSDPKYDYRTIGLK